MTVLTLGREEAEEFRLANPPSTIVRRPVELPRWPAAVSFMQENPAQWAVVHEDYNVLVSVLGYPVDFRNAVRAGRVDLPDGVWDFIARRSRSKPGMRYTDERRLFGRFLGASQRGGVWLMPGIVGNPMVRIQRPEDAPIEVAA